MGPFAVAANGSSVQTATGPQSLLSISAPFTKLDVTNTVSFQTIQLLLNHEPPQAPAGAPYYTDTVVGQFKHGYTYIPGVWMNWQNVSANPNPGTPPSGGSNTASYPNGDDSSGFDAWNAIYNSNINANPNSPLAFEQYNNGSGAFNATVALLYLTVDKTYVYIHIMKETLVTVGGNIVPLFLIGYILNLRVYVFTEPGTTSTY